MNNGLHKAPPNSRLPRGGTPWILFRSVASIALLAYLTGTPATASEPSHGTSNASQVPAWVFPLNPPASASSPPFDKITALHVPNSNVSFTEAELNDLFKAPDWHPQSHSKLPSIVANGRPPDVYACGFCHTAGGQGRPENASLAGLPAAYIVSQLADFRSGKRKSAWNGPYRPADRMIDAAANATDEELLAAATYFSAQSLRPRVTVVEVDQVPVSHVVGWVYVAQPGGGNEPLGQRLLEFAPDPVSHENRDDKIRYIAYVPVGSIERGKHIAQKGWDSLANACSVCHGPQLHGMGNIPPIAGRSPTYILRQLLAFQTGARSGATGLPMHAVVKDLKIAVMVDAAAYTGSLQP